MATRRVRRVPVVDDRGDCIGIIALADLARVAETHEEPNEREVGRVLEQVSQASDDARSEMEVGVYADRLAAAQPHPV